MNPRILAIDDEEEWLENFRSWIPQTIALQDSADTTPKAIEFLRRCRYHAVLLDLSMDLGDRQNRDNRSIQNYLATRPEGTAYIIVSGTIQIEEMRDSAFHLNAHYIFLKDSIEPGAAREKVVEAIQEASKRDTEFVADARRKITATGQLEDQILKTLHPADGAKGMYLMLDTLLRRLSPVVPHRDRPHFQIWKNTVVGLVWSRQLGMAVSIVLANRHISEEESSMHFRDWLGYSQQQRPVFTRDIAGVRVQFFAEATISDAHFDLPMAAALL